MILRLRQICSHPALAQERASAYFDFDEEPEEVDRAVELRRAIDTVGLQYVKDLQRKYLRIALERAALGAEVRLSHDYSS